MRKLLQEELQRSNDHTERMTSAFEALVEIERKELRDEQYIMSCLTSKFLYLLYYFLFLLPRRLIQ